ncbi:hypothetical protein K2173_026028 [Erythroxylum novogranatense]|uniref:Reverse transcriptase Ty1/copia-type domain-containing protein n=1 Tax=Erythroxylum novogranatense TaxID=1862640 RepID=A0AAV8SIP1_9ROSI|nr:hypothetical protein K2173_026028 [Erythroxylum novogranatense]
MDNTPVRGTRLLFDIYQRCNIAVCEPPGYMEAKENQNWMDAMNEELSMIKKNKTWELVDRPYDRKVTGVKWVFRTKLNPDGSIYVEQPEGFVEKGAEDKVYLLRKALYGLKQAPRAWYSRIDDYLISLGFEKSLSELTLYVKHDSIDILIISLYVDDLLITGSNSDWVNKFKLEMKTVFEMTDIGLMTYFLGMEVEQSQDEVFICQKKYAKEILKKFQMEDCKEMRTPMNQKEKLVKEDGAAQVDETEFRSLIGCLMYLTATRPNILNAVSILSRFMHCPNETHMRAAKRVIRYIKGTWNYGVKFMKSKELKLIGFSDSDWGGSIDDMKSTYGYCFTFGSGMFSWSPKKQETVA